MFIILLRALYCVLSYASTYASACAYTSNTLYSAICKTRAQNLLSLELVRKQARVGGSIFDKERSSYRASREIIVSASPIRASPE